MKLFHNYLDNYRNIPILCWNLLFLTLIESLGGGLGFFISLYFKAYLNLQLSEIGKILSCYGLGTIAGGWLGGQMIDRFSASLTNIMSLFLFGICFIFLAFFTQSRELIIIMFIMGCASYGFIASNSVLLLRTADQNEPLRLKLLNLKNVASNIGMGLAASLLAIYGNYSFQTIFIIVGCMLFGAGMYQYKLSNLYESVLLKNFSKIQTIRHKSAKRNSKKLFHITLLCVFFTGLIVMQHKVAYPIFVKSSFDSPAIIALIFALNPLIIILLQPAIVNFIGRFNTIVMMGFGAVCLSIGVIILNISHALPIFLLSVFLYTLGEMLFFSLSQLLCYQSQGEQNKGKALGMWRVAYASSSVIGPYFGGVIYEWGGANTVWLLCGCLGIFCYVLTIYLQFDIQLKLIYRAKKAS